MLLLRHQNYIIHPQILQIERVYFLYPFLGRLKPMAVIKQERKSKKTGKIKRIYMASQWHPLLKKRVYGLARTNKKEAKQDDAALVLAIKKEVKEKKVKKKSEELFGAVADAWLNANKKTYADQTWKTYRDYLNRYIRPVFGDVKISDIESQHILNFKSSLENGHNSKKHKYGAETVNKNINVLCDVFNFAISPLKLIDGKDNPMIGIKRNKVPYVAKSTWSDEQISIFLTSREAKESPYYAMFCCQILLGPRPSETCGLAESDYDPDRQCFYMHRTLNKYGVLEDSMKNNNSFRAVYLPATLNHIVKQKLLWKKEMRLKYPDLFNNDFLFSTGIGTPVRPDHLYRMFTRVEKRYNMNHIEKLPVITLYDCRHTFATTNYERGESDKVLSEIMGNTPATFLQKYAHIHMDRKQKSLDSFEGIIFKSGNEI